MRIREMRLKAGMTQEDLAAAIHCTAPAISHYENGRRDMPVSTLVAIALALNCSVDDLIREEAERGED